METLVPVLISFVLGLALATIRQIAGTPYSTNEATVTPEEDSAEEPTDPDLSRYIDRVFESSNSNLYKLLREIRQTRASMRRTGLVTEELHEAMDNHIDDFIEIIDDFADIAQLVVKDKEIRGESESLAVSAKHTESEEKRRFSLRHPRHFG
jgi:hypothetical protein